MARVVVVGAGLGGLAAAARLAALGHEVTVCEQAPQVGGKLGVLAKDGFVFDTGPSLLTLPAVYRDLFLATGGPLEAELPLVSVDPVCAYRFGDGTRLKMPNGPRGAIARAWDEALGAGAGADWTAFLSRAGAIWDATRATFLEAPLDGTRTLLAQARRLHDLRTVAPWLSLRDLGRRYLRHPHQRTFLDRYATYTGSDPRRAPAALATVPYVEQTFGAWYVPGGLRRLVDAVHSRAVERGAELRLAAPVDGILLDGSVRPAGVRLADSDRLPPDGRVAHAGPPTSSSRPPTPRTSTAPCSRRRPVPGPCGRSAVPSRRSRDSSCCSRCAAGRRGSRITPCSSPPTTTTSSTRSSARGGTGARARARSPTRPSTSARPTTPRCAPTTTTRPGSCSSTRRATCRPGTRRTLVASGRRAWTGTPPGCATATRTASSR